ncbi:MAG TPA: YtxH domain-containing protein [Chthonomonadaceae bacterium]|nr:YtxH domain-containing protein [Chthonomonadaceae bacterium]
MNRDNWGSNLVFFLLGAACGAAVALLYAPQEGEETRRFIGQKASEVKDKATEVTTNLTQAAKEKASMISDKMQDMVNRGQQAAGDSLNAAADQARTTANSIS